MTLLLFRSRPSIVAIGSGERNVKIGEMVSPFLIHTAASVPE